MPQWSALRTDNLFADKLCHVAGPQSFEPQGDFLSVSGYGRFRDLDRCSAVVASVLVDLRRAVGLVVTVSELRHFIVAGLARRCRVQGLREDQVEAIRSRVKLLHLERRLAGPDDAVE